MSEHTLSTNSSYTLPIPVYNQCIWIVKDMDRLRIVAGMDYEAPDVAEARRRVEAYDLSVNVIPEDFRYGVIRNISYGREFADIASESTWRRWKRKFLYTFARNLGLY